MADLFEITAWIFVIAILFAIIHFPFKGTNKTIKRKNDATIEFVNKKPILVDKRRWDVEIFR